MIRIGVCGLGLRVGQLIRESLNACNIDFRVVGVVDPDEPRVRSLMRAEDRDAKFFSSADEMIRSVKPDALMVGTRCHLHTPYALELEKYHLPIFLEKPVANSMEQALELERVYRDSATPVLVSFPLRLRQR